MIRLEVNGQALQLGGSGINLKGKSPLLDRNRMPGIRNLPFKVPATDANRKVLGFPDDYHTAELPSPQPCDVLVNDDLYLEGELRVMEATELWIECEVLDPLNLFYDKYGSLSIRFLDMGLVDYHNTLASITFEFLTDQNGDPFQVTYTIHFNGNTYTYQVQAGDSLADISIYFWGQINTGNPGYATRTGNNFEFLHINQPAAGDPFEVGWAPDVQQPVPVWAITGYTSRAAARVTDWTSWVTDVVNNNGNYDYCLPVLSVPYLYEDNNSLFNGLANYWATAPVPNDPQSSEVWEYACLPCVKLEPVLVKLFEEAGYTLEIDPDFASSREFDKVYLLNLYSIDEVHRIWDELGQVWELQNVFQYTFELAKCLPEISFKEVINGTRITFCAEFDWQPKSNKVILKAADEALASAASETLNLEVLGDYRIRYLYDKGYTFSHNKSVEVPENLVNAITFVDSYKEGEGQTQIKNPFGVIIVTNANGITGDRLPYWPGRGHSDYFEMGYDTWPAMLGLYRGLSVAPGDYPLGTADDKDYGGQPIANTYSLAWEGDQGLIATFYSKWIHFMTHTLELEMYVNPEDLMPSRLSFFQPYRALDDQWVLGEYLLKLPSQKKQQIRIYRF